jgi:hypothetical protein
MAGLPPKISFKIKRILFTSLTIYFKKVDFPEEANPYNRVYENPWGKLIFKSYSLFFQACSST